MDLVLELIEAFLTGIWKFEAMEFFVVDPAVGAQSSLVVDVVALVGVLSSLE